MTKFWEDTCTVLQTGGQLPIGLRGGSVTTEVTFLKHSDYIIMRTTKQH